MVRSALDAPNMLLNRDNYPFRRQKFTEFSTDKRALLAMVTLSVIATI